jgi:hypothetical protein
MTKSHATVFATDISLKNLPAALPVPFELVATQFQPLTVTGPTQHPEQCLRPLK